MNILSITGALFSLVSLVLMFVQWRWTAVVAFVGLLLTVLGSSGFAGAMLPLFWGFAALVVVGLNYMLPREVVASRLGVGYIGLGGLTGLVLGYLISVNVMVIGAVVGIGASSRFPLGPFFAVFVCQRPSLSRRALDGRICGHNPY